MYLISNWWLKQLSVEVQIEIEIENKNAKCKQEQKKEMKKNDKVNVEIIGQDGSWMSIFVIDKRMRK